jgi:hypothetical protein
MELTDGTTPRSLVDRSKQPRIVPSASEALFHGWLPIGKLSHEFITRVLAVDFEKNGQSHRSFRFRYRRAASRILSSSIPGDAPVGIGAIRDIVSAYSVFAVFNATHVWSGKTWMTWD